MHYISWAFSTLHCTLAVRKKSPGASFFFWRQIQKGVTSNNGEEDGGIGGDDFWMVGMILAYTFKEWDFGRIILKQERLYSVYWHPWIHGPFQAPFFPWGIPWILCVSMATGTVSNYVSTLWPVTMMTATGYTREYQVTYVSLTWLVAPLIFVQLAPEHTKSSFASHLWVLFLGPYFLGGRENCIISHHFAKWGQGKAFSLIAMDQFTIPKSCWHR